MSTTYACAAVGLENDDPNKQTNTPNSYSSSSKALSFNRDSYLCFCSTFIKNHPSKQTNTLNFYSQQNNDSIILLN